MFDIILNNHQVWAICGGRSFRDEVMFNSAMGDLLRIKGCPRCIVHGAAHGADHLASKWATRHGVDIVRMPADWNKHGKAAGPIRNQSIIDHYKPEMLVAFPGGKGTADMIERANRAKITVAEIKT